MQKRPRGGFFFFTFRHRLAATTSLASRRFFFTFRQCLANTTTLARKSDPEVVGRPARCAEYGRGSLNLQPIQVNHIYFINLSQLDKKRRMRNDLTT